MSRFSGFRRAIIGLLVALPLLSGLGGCGAVRLTYNNGGQLTWWWLDGYIDFSREQAPAARAAIDSFFDWHRRTQLAELAPLLAQAQPQVLEPTTAAAVCRWQDVVRQKLEPALTQALAQGAELLPGLGPVQYKAIEKKYAKNIAELREEYLQPDLAERQAEGVKRTLERAERLYGRLDDAQKRVIRDGVAASPFNPEAWMAERLRRQRDTLATVRRLVADKADLPTRVAALRGLVQRTEQSPDAEYRAYQGKLSDYNCAFSAQLHNATTPAQRQKARANLKGWEEDLRALMAGPPPKVSE